MHIDITEFLTSLRDSRLIYFSASRAEYGEDAAKLTWENAMDRADPESEEYVPLLKNDEELNQFRRHVGGFGAWEKEEIEGWSKHHCEALFIQIIAGDLREARIDPKNPDWNTYQVLAEKGSVAGNISVGDSDASPVFYYLSGC